MIEYEIRPTPPLEAFGGPRDDDPTNFIYLNVPAVEGVWDHDSVHLAISLEDAPRDEWKQPRVVAPGRRANGRLYLQIASDGSMHIEYIVEVLEGREIPPKAHPVYDEQLTAALAQWFEANPDGIQKWVLQHAGELR